MIVKYGMRRRNLIEANPNIRQIYLALVRLITDKRRGADKKMLASALRRFFWRRSYFVWVICRDADQIMASIATIPIIPWQKFLLVGWPAGGPYDDSFIKELASMITHEVVHLNQKNIKQSMTGMEILRALQNDDVNTLMAYLSMPHEIEAYAAQTAMALLDIAGDNPDRAMHILQHELDQHADKNWYTNGIQNYAVIGQRQDPEVFHKFIREVTRYIQALSKTA